MSVKIIMGAIGAGKTKYCIDEISAAHLKNPKSRCIMIVPPHYSHETERMLINTFGGTGLNNIECTTFEKLARELLPNSPKRLGASGKNVLVCRAIKETLAEIENGDTEFDRKLIRAVSKSGFVDVASSLLNEFHRYSINNDILDEQAQNQKNPLLSQKLKIMSLILRKYENLSEKIDYVDADDDLTRLGAVIGNYFNDDDNIWIDKFDEFLPQQFEVLRAIFDSNANVTITFSVCPNYSDTYYGTRSTIAQISEYTSADIIRLNGEMKHINVEDLRFLFTNWFNHEVYCGDKVSAEIFTARDAYTETENTARKILDCVREDGYRFCDIGLLLPSQEDYTHVIEAVFDEYEIPYYTDTKIAISQYPIATQITSLFNIIENNWNYESMFEYLRAGFVYVKTHANGKVRYEKLNPDSIDILENYVLKYGIQYKNNWCKSWLTNSYGVLDTAFDKEPSQHSALETTDELREIIVTPISLYCDRVKNGKTVSDYCHALFAFLEDINLYQGLKSDMLKMAKEDATQDVQQFGQIWNLILNILDEVNTALGSEEVTHEEFAEYILAAMSQCEIRTVPSGIDRVFICSADANRAIPTPVMFVMGAIEGTFPKTTAQEGFLSNSDRLALSDGDMRIAPTTDKKAEKQVNTVYKLLSAVKDRLYISYPSMNSEGGANLPSQLISDILTKLPNTRKTEEAIGNEPDIMYISSPKATLHRLLMTGTDNPLWSHVNAWFSEREEWSKKLYRVNHAKYNFIKRNVELDPDIARELYNDKSYYSATRLNTYANCPFGHFMQYGLGAKEREEYEIQAKDTGTYAHEVIQRFCRKVTSWDSMDDDKCTEYVSEIVSDTLDKINSSDLRDKEMTADILSRMGDTVTNAAKAVVKSIKCGQFTIDSCEKKVSVKLSDNIELGGIIDRLDVCRHDGVNEYRIIDYKTGSKAFSVADIYNGLDMQPVIYALAMEMTDDKAVISGMYYGMVHNDFAEAESTARPTTILNSLKKNTAYNGITFMGNDIDKPIPYEELDRVEFELSRQEEGVFIVEKKGVTSYGATLRTRPEGQMLIDKVRQNIITADRDIRNGKIDIAPLTDTNSSACTFCQFSRICRFDEEFKTERTIQEKDSEIWDILEEEI